MRPAARADDVAWAGAWLSEARSQLRWPMLGWLVSGYHVGEMVRGRHVASGVAFAAWEGGPGYHKAAGPRPATHPPDPCKPDAVAGSAGCQPAE